MRKMGEGYTAPPYTILKDHPNVIGDQDWEQTAQALSSKLAASSSTEKRSVAPEKVSALLIKCFVCVLSLQTALKCLASRRV